jgi:hypothetical protein
MANDSFTQQALAQDRTFQGRIRSALASVAWQVSAEADTVPNHAQRKAYARMVLDSLTTVAQSIAPWLVTRPNLFAFPTSYDFKMGSIVTASGDPDIESQLMTDWDFLASNTVPPAGVV